MSFEHIPVLKNEVISGLNIDPAGVYVEGTLGGGGHSGEILRRIPEGHLFGIDQDDAALQAADQHLASIGDNYTLLKGNFVEMKELLHDQNIEKVNGILLDIGVSSHQFDTGERGFSYRFDGPLDMRMDPSGDLTAWYIVNTYDEEKLSQIFWDYGEERWGKRIAEFIINARKNAPIETTFELVDIIKKAIPGGARREGGHPAKKTFQALRIAVNRELDVLEEVIPEAVSLLKPKGRLAIITFHSLEDRIVKNSFKYLYKDCICPPRQPICTCNKKREIKIITRKPVTATEEELTVNNRSHSAKLRIAEKI